MLTCFIRAILSNQNFCNSLCLLLINILSWSQNDCLSSRHDICILIRERSRQKKRRELCHYLFLLIKNIKPSPQAPNKLLFALCLSFLVVTPSKLSPGYLCPQQFIKCCSILRASTERCHMEEPLQLNGL